ncbi:MAG: PA14 domain-containing protein, partial [Limisphaerales bacterium]
MNPPLGKCDLALVALGLTLVCGAHGEGARVSVPAPITNVLEVAGHSSQNPQTAYSIHLKGTILWANGREGRFVLQDESGTEELQMNLGNRLPTPGQIVRVDGNATITTRAGGYQLGTMGALVDDDGIHTMTEKSGSAYLSVGRHALRLDWFNGPDKYGLEVDYAGPRMPRRKVPDAALWRKQPGSAREFAPGLDYACYPAPGEVLPDFSELRAIATGTVSNFDLGVLRQTQHIGLEFTGYLNVPRDGLYTFYLNSDDGSRLFLDGPAPVLTIIGATNLPEPTPLEIGRVLSGRAHGGGDDYQRVEVEGRVTFASRERMGWELELASETGRLQIQLANGSGLSASNILNARVSVVGISQRAYDADGDAVGGVLLVSDARAIRVLKPGEPAAGAGKKPGLPLLTTASQVHELSREEAQRGYPVRIRGVVTCVLPERQAFTIQDATRGIYVVDSSESRSVAPAIGEYLEIEGKTDPSLFAPIIDASRVRDLGAGCLPRPIQPTWDRLMNGSLDAQYVELQGVI